MFRCLIDSSRVVRAGGNIEYRNKWGHLHRDDGPAIEWPNGSKFWYQNGIFIRSEGPAIRLENSYVKVGEMYQAMQPEYKKIPYQYKYKLYKQESYEYQCVYQYGYQYEYQYEYEPYKSFPVDFEVKLKDVEIQQPARNSEGNG